MLPSRRTRWFYWGGLAILLTVLVLLRKQAYYAGGPSSSDLVVLIVWLTLLLAPLFQVVELSGLKVQHQMDEVKRDVAHELSVFRTEIAATISGNSTASSAVNFYSLPNAEQLQTLAKQVAFESAVQRSSTHIGGTVKVSTERPDVPSQIEDMFAFRFDLEQKLNRIRSSGELGHAAGASTYNPAISIIRTLAVRGFLSNAETDALRTIWNITSLAVHGRPLPPDALKFVRETYPPISKALDQVVDELTRRMETKPDEEQA